MTATGELVVRSEQSELAGPIQFDREKVDLLKRTICRGSTDDELELFIHACTRLGLDPFMRQIHAVKRYDKSAKREVMSIQTGIDGYRLVAERTGRYMPGREPTFEYDGDYLIKATAYVKKFGPDRQWHEVAASAHFDEYAAYYTPANGEPQLTAMWKNKPHIMLAKCAEALVLRKAFPAELSGVYTAEEMEAGSGQPQRPEPAPVNNRITENPSDGNGALHEGDLQEPEEEAPSTMETGDGFGEPSEDEKFLIRLTEAFDANGSSETTRDNFVAAVCRKHKIKAITDLIPEKREEMLKAVSGQRAKPAKLTDAQAAYLTFIGELEGIRDANGMDPAQFDRGVKKFIASKKLQGREWEMSQADRDALRSAVIEKRGNFASQPTE